MWTEGADRLFHDQLKCSWASARRDSLLRTGARKCYVERMLSVAEYPSVAALCRAGEHLSEDLRAAVLADRERAVPALLEVLSDAELSWESAPNGGWAPIHAVDLLVALGADEAIQPILELLTIAGWDDLLHARAVTRVVEFGAAVLEPALSLLGRTTDPDAQHALACVLAALGVRDERIYAVLHQLFESDPIRTACCLSDYGDLRGLDLLHGAIMDFETDYSSVGNRWDFRCFVEQYRAFGTSLPPALADHVAELEKNWELALHRAPQPVMRTTGVKLGRNDRCRCGSGKKYKKCCLGKVPV